MPGKTTAAPRITKFTNCRLVRGSSLVEQDLWIDSLTGKILKDQEAFYGLHLSPDEIVDLGGRILAPGLIDVQLNGAHGFDFSVPCDTKEEYDDGLHMVNRGLARTGVTSYMPTIISSTREVYWKVQSNAFLSCHFENRKRTNPSLTGSAFSGTFSRHTSTRTRIRVSGSPRRGTLPQPRPQWHSQVRSTPRRADLRRSGRVLRQRQPGQRQPN